MFNNLLRVAAMCIEGISVCVCVCGGWRAGKR